MAKKRKTNELVAAAPGLYGGLVTGIADLLDEARRGAARTVNSILTVAYWEIGRRIVEFEQGGKAQAEYGESLLVRLGEDLSARYGRGFSWRNLFRMRNFYLGWEVLPTPSAKFEARARLPDAPGASNAILPTPSAISPIPQTVSAESGSVLLSAVFPLSWSHYVRLMSVDKPHARAFYESEAIRGGW